jgi:hypothetical protein
MSDLSRTVTRTTLRTGIALFVALTLSGVALAQRNDGGGPNKQSCEAQATSDYQTNLASCRANLSDDKAQEALCEQDFSYDYLDALAACGDGAAISKVPVGRIGGITRANPGLLGNGNKGGKGAVLGLGVTIHPVALRHR